MIIAEPHLTRVTSADQHPGPGDHTSCIRSTTWQGGGVASVDVSVAALLVVIVLSIIASRRAAYERVLATTDLIAQGDPARARHRLGTLSFEHRRDLHLAQVQLQRAERDDRIEDLFTILTVAIRLNAVRTSLSFSARGPRLLLVGSTSNWVEYWVRQVPFADSTITQLKAVAHGLGAELDHADGKIAA